MSINKCRVCKRELFDEPLLQYKNMPSAAQLLPDVNSINNDQGVDLKVYQCSTCGLVQLGNNPVPYYKEVIRAAAISDEMQAFRKAQFGNFVKKFQLKGKKVIEIGCGRGEYLSLMDQSNVEAFGLEQSAASVKDCVKNGLKVEQGFIQNSADSLNHAPFDAFFMLNFLEHLPEPDATLRGIHNNLTKDAVGLVEVPNFNMIIKKKLFAEFIGDHLFYFTQETLNLTLRLNGFDIIENNVVWHDYIISAVVKKSKEVSPSTTLKSPKITQKLDLTNFYEYQTHIKNTLHEYIRRFNHQKVAIWGAGHQALAIISMAALAGKIKYVVDSAPFKQGKYTPATHIPIVNPDTLKTDPVEAVIVMAASYSDEVAKIIRQKYNKKIKLAILRDFGLELLD